MSDTIVVMSHGKIQQIGSPTDIYNEPVNAFVADFIGRKQHCRRNYERGFQGFIRRAGF